LFIVTSPRDFTTWLHHVTPPRDFTTWLHHVTSSCDSNLEYTFICKIPSYITNLEYTVCDISMQNLLQHYSLLYRYITIFLRKYNFYSTPKTAKLKMFQVLFDWACSKMILENASLLFTSQASAQKLVKSNNSYLNLSYIYQN
jgi:hypothetical protein